jgi:hypothetical protein
MHADTKFSIITCKMFGHVERTHSLIHSNAIEDLVHKDEIRQQKMHRRGVDQFIKRSRMKDERDIHNIHIDERSTEARRKARRGR